MTGTRFIIDSNILIESKNLDYGFDICPGFWDLLRKGFEEGFVISHDKVHAEIKRGGDDLWEWVKSLPRDAFPKETDEEFAAYLEICRWAREGGRYKPQAIDRFCESSYADPWICAKAKVAGITLVTQEMPAPESRRDVKLPDACKAAGVSYCNKYAMLRELRACFVLDDGHRF